MNRRAILLFALVLALAPLARTAPPAAWGGVLYVKVAGPEGMLASFVNSHGFGPLYPTPHVTAFRTGFIYRAKLDHIPDRPGLELYPTFEVLGTLQLPAAQRLVDHPVPVQFTLNDLDRAAAGTMVTKIYVVERVDAALPAALVEGQAWEREVAAGENAWEQAKAIGRPVLIVRLGCRKPENGELAGLAPGRLWTPESVIRDACLPGCPPYGGMMHPALRQLQCDCPDECIRDGGDRGRPAGLDARGLLRGLDPSDTVAEYTDSKGNRQVTPSNETCLCVPRFVVFRQLLPLAGFDSVREPAPLQGDWPARTVDMRQDSRRTRQVDEPDLLRNRQKLHQASAPVAAGRLLDVQVLQGVYLNLGAGLLLGTDQLGTLREAEKTRLVRQVEEALRLTMLQNLDATQGTIGAKAVGVVEGLGQVTGAQEACVAKYLCPPEKPEPPDRPLQVLKWVSTTDAQLGDTVTFYISYTNTGGKPIQNIAVSDSLSPRLEYVPGTARSDREAIFVTQENEAGAAILRWEIKDPLPPCAKGVVTFQAKVR